MGNAGPGNAAWLAGGGEMGDRIRAFNWSRTAIGSPGTWSPALLTMVRFLLVNRFPLLLWWGPQYVSIYNDAYRPILGNKHPWGLGRPLRQCWSEIWDILKPLVDTPFNGGPATWNEDIELEINRHGFTEETHFTVAYSPVPDETAASGIGGVLATVHEITEKVVGERRVAALRDLSAGAIGAKSAEGACIAAAETLKRHAKDVPFALIYLIAPDGKEARLASAAGANSGGRFAPDRVELAEAFGGASWPLAKAANTARVEVVDNLVGRFGKGVPAGPWSDPPRGAVVVPIRSSIAQKLAGFLVAGISARLKLDELYRSFYELLASHIATGIANARAYEEERRRGEALAEIDRAKTAFFSNVSHEFRTPLTLMMSPVEEVLADSHSRVAPKHRTLLSVAHRNSLRLLRLVNTVLDFSRVEAGRIQASYEPVDLAAVTTELASNFRSACERAGLALEVRCSSLEQPVYVDREMWEKIVLNLVSNAFKFTLEGRIEVAVQSDGSNAVLVVKDSGVGIPEAELPRIFERFHRVEGQQGRTHEGTGIGLALVQELVRLHGGEIQAESEVGIGTTFVARIPFGPDHLPADRVHAARSLASTAIGANAFVEEALRWLPSADAQGIAEAMVDHLGPRTAAGPTDRERARVLVVDDNADMREHLSHLLARWWDVEAASDGQAALDAARRSKPNLVVADVMMPRLDGIGLLSALRSDPDLLDVPVILLSARAGDEARDEGLRAGADDYLVKPFSARELLARVRSNLSLARLRAEELASMTRLHELSTRLTAMSDLPSILHEVLGATMELQGADFGDVQLYDKATGTLKIAAHRGVSQEFLDYFDTVDASDTSACGLALRAGDRIIIEDVDTDPAYEPHRDIAASTGYRGVLSTPLFDRNTGKLVVMLSALFREPYRPSARDVRLTDLYARQAADVISLRLAQERLRESEARLKAAVDLVRLGCYTWNPQTNALQWDATVKAMWGLPADAQVDYDMWCAGVHPDDLARVEAAIRQSADPRGDGAYDIEYRVIRKNDGVERWIATRGQTYFHNGGPVSFYGVAIDVTDRKHIENTLERRVEARTRELEEANRQLREQIAQREMAEAAVRQLQRLDAIGQITSGVAHDFNNLLSVVLTNTRLLSRRLRETEDHEGLELIRAAAKRGAKLTAQLLAFSRKQRLDPEVVDLNSKILSMSELLGVTLGGTANLETVLAPDLWLALVDPTQLELIVLNLAINGRDAMGSGGTLTIQTFNAVIDGEPAGPEAPSPGDYVALAVIDIGVGIPDDVLPRVFEPFFTTKQPGRGSGLGLSQVFGFAKQSDGGVRIDTVVGEGTSVTVYLRRAEQAVDDPGGDGVEAEPPAPTRGQACVLVVDDDAVVLTSTLIMLRSLGYAAVGARDGREALRSVADNPQIDLVLTDFAMPGMNGVELARAIRAERSSLPVIFVTGYGDRDEFREFGPSHILQKPYAEGDLAATIGAVLNHIEARPGSESQITPR